LSQSTTTVRFKEGQISNVQTFDLGQPVTSISKWADETAKITLTAAERKFVHEDDWRIVRPNSRHSAKATQPTAQQIMKIIQRKGHVIGPHRSSEQLGQETSTTRQEQKAAVARRLAHEARRLEAALKRSEQASQRARDNDRLDAALPAVLQARKEARANKIAVKIITEARRVEAERKRQENRRQQRSRDFQQACYLKEKYGSFSAGLAAIDCVQRPSKRNLAKLRARQADAVAADIVKKHQQSLTDNEPFDLAAAIAKSWKQREPIPPDPPANARPSQSLILDTGYSGKNLLTAEAAAAAQLPLTGPSNTTIIDAHGNASRAESKTQVNRPGLPMSAGEGVINSSARFSLAGRDKLCR